jgi:hypothetical protein
MNQPKSLSRFTWFFIGLATGLAAMFFYQTGARGTYAHEYADSHLDYYLKTRAQMSYGTEEKHAAIYALSEYLRNVGELKRKQYSYFEMSGDPVNLMEAHARLARLYADAGEPELSAQHAAQAIRFAGDTGRSYSMTNTATVLKFADEAYGKPGK